MAAEAVGKSTQQAPKWLSTRPVRAMEGGRATLDTLEGCVYSDCATRREFCIGCNHGPPGDSVGGPFVYASASALPSCKKLSSKSPKESPQYEHPRDRHSQVVQ